MFVNTLETFEKYVMDVFAVQQPRGPELFVVVVYKILLGFELAIYSPQSHGDARSSIYTNTYHIVYM